MPDTLTIPEGATIDWGGLHSMIGIMDRLRERDNEDKVEAIRYQGQQDYSQMVAAGADPMDAMLKVAPKLFHRNPAGLAQVVEAKQRQEVARRRAQSLAIPAEIVTMDGDKFIKRPTPEGGSTLIHVPRAPVPRPTPSDPIFLARIGAAKSRLMKVNEVLALDPEDKTALEERRQALMELGTLERSGPGRPRTPLGPPMPLPADTRIPVPGPAPSPFTNAPVVSRVWDSATKSWRK